VLLETSGDVEREEYCEFVTDKFDLRKDMQFNTSITTAQYQEEGRSWRLIVEDGMTYTCRWLITAMGVLNIPSLDSFRGESFHTARWSDNVFLEGKRVSIIGVGATGIQTITEIYPQCASLTVFQRTPNWTGPLRNAKIDEEEMNDIRQRYPDILQGCRDSAACFLHTPVPRSIWDVSEEERLQHWELGHSLPGFGKWGGNFRDVYSDRKANKMY
jgi:cation diffusion facilitator CzcD-associated flavoprotein CzcO